MAGQESRIFLAESDHIRAQKPAANSKKPRAAIAIPMNNGSSCLAFAHVGRISELPVERRERNISSSIAIVK
jgi:hypothetical protein